MTNTLANSMRVHVASISFCKNAELVSLLRQSFPNCKLNTEGKILHGPDLSAFLQDADAAIIGNEIVDDAMLSLLPKLKVISKYGVGLDNLDLQSMERRGVKLGWKPGVNKRAVAELVLTFMLGCSRNVFASNHELKQGRWLKSGGCDLSGKTIGIVGCGQVGSEVLKLLQPFGCKLLVNDIVDKSLLCVAYGAFQVGIDELRRESDIVTLHVPLTQETRRMVDIRFLEGMKSSGILINTSRGAVVDQCALKEALMAKSIRAAALDVFDQEPVTDMELVGLENFWGTAHIGGNSIEAITAMGKSAVNGLTCEQIS